MTSIPAYDQHNCHKIAKYYSILRELAHMGLIEQLFMGLAISWLLWDLPGEVWPRKCHKIAKYDSILRKWPHMVLIKQLFMKVWLGH